MIELACTLSSESIASTLSNAHHLPESHFHTRFFFGTVPET